MKSLFFCTIFLTLSCLQAATITVGIPQYYPPFVMNSGDKSHNLVGFDIDLLDEIFKRLHTKYQFKPIDIRKANVALANGQIDLAIGGIIITPYREEHFLFSLPYKVSYGQYITKVNSNIHSVRELSGKRIGTMPGSPFENSLKESGYSKEIKLYDSAIGLLDALNTDQIDAILFDAAATFYWLANNDNVYQSVGHPIRTGLGYGIMTTKNKTELINQVNKTLLSIEADGTYLEIYSLYYGNF